MTGQTISHFRILEKLGGGGMGVVYLAEDTRLDRKVALKFLPPHLNTDEEARLRFVQEAKAASALNHPNICTVHDIGQGDDGQTFIAMARYEGETLKARLERGPLPAREAADIARQVAEGLAAAHERGIIHRDIKPANIFITDRARAVILDFGLAKLTGAIELTKSGSTLGTVHYMSPEQIRGETVDRETDIWSLGVVLYEMVAGERPFVGDYEQAISYAILNNESKPLTDGSEHLNGVVQDCLQKRAEDRLQDASVLVTRLEMLRGSTTSEPSVAGTEMTRPSRRLSPGCRPGIWVAAIAFVAVVTASAFYFVHFLSVRAPDANGPVRLVVLPFQNLGPSDHDYFADGLTEELSARLGSIDALAVIAQSSANRIKESGMTIEEIGTELGVAYVLEGTVRWESIESDDRVRITPKLIRVSDGTQVWSDTYQRRVEGIFEIQEDVGRSVASALDVTLLQGDREQLAQQPTENPEAYQAYLRGVALRRSSASEPELAARAFEQAVRLDPQFADAHYKRVHMYSLAAWLGLPEDQARHDSLARGALSELTALAAGELQEHPAQGYVAYYLDVDYERARREFEKAAELRPGTLEVVEALGPIYRRLGRYQKAVDMLERAIQIDPLNTTDAHEAALTYMIMKRHQDAERMLDYAIQIEPRNDGPYCWKSLNRLLWTGSSVDARQAQDAATGQTGSALCWWADLAERNFAAIVSNLNRININDLGRSWFGLIFPQDIGQYYFRKALAMHYLGDRDGEVESWRGLLSVTRSDLAPQERQTDRFRANETRAWLALALANAGLGEREDALSRLSTLRQKTSHDVFAVDGRRMYMAIAYTLLGETDEAVRLLEEDVIGAGLTTLYWLEMPLWDPLRDHPGFRGLAEARQ